MIRFCRLLSLLLPVVLLSALHSTQAAELPAVAASSPIVAPSLGLRGPVDRAALLRWREQTRTRGAKAQVAANTSVNVPEGIISTFAGAVPFQQPSTALNTSLGNISGMAMDANGNLFVSTSDFRSVQKIDPAGNVTVYAGIPLPVGPLQATGDGGPATAATLVNPEGLAVDAAGNLYIADLGSYTVRMVSAATGVITTVAGTTGKYGYSPDGTLATSALLDRPNVVIVDANGNLFFFDDQEVRRVDHSTGLLSTFAGTTNYTSSGLMCQQLSATQTCPATTVGLDPDPYDAVNGMAISSGNLYLSVVQYTLGSLPYDTEQHGGAILSVELSTGTMRLVAGGALPGAPPTTTAIGATIYPLSIGVDGRGNVDFLEGNASPYSYGAEIIMQLPANGTTLTTIAGTGQIGSTGDGGPATAAEIFYAESLILGTTGDILFAEPSRIRSIDLTGTVSTLAGDGDENYFGDGGKAQAAGIGGAGDAILDAQGNLYIADGGNGVVRRVDATTGIITTIAGNGGIADYLGTSSPDGLPGDGGPATGTALDYPAGLALDNTGNLYINDELQGIRVVHLNTGILTTLTQSVAGAGTMAFDGMHTLYAVNGEQVDAVDTITGAATAIAGNGASTVELNGSLGDGGPALKAPMFPAGVALDSSGNLYVSDALENVIRIVNLSTGIINQYAGSYADDDIINYGYSGDGGPAAAAVFGFVGGIHNDGAGHLLIADEGKNNVIRQIDLNMTIINTVAGNGTPGFSGDGGSQTAAALNFPRSATADALGDLYIADAGNDRIRLVTLDRSLLTGTLTAPSSSFAVGANVVLTATFAGATANAPTGSVTFYDGLSEIGTGTLAASAIAGSYVATLTDTTLALGAHSIKAQFGGDQNYSPATTAAVTITATPAPAVLTAALTASASSVTAGASVTLTAAFTGLTGGNVPQLNAVTFYDGTTVVPANSDTGSESGNVYTVTLTTTGLAVGQHNLTAKFAGDANYAAVTTSPILVTVLAPAIPPSYTVTAAPASLTVPQGSTGTAVFTVTPAGGFASAVSFSCGSALPTGVSCTFAPASVTPTGAAAVTTTLTVTTTAADLAAVHPLVKTDGRWWFSGGLSLACLLMVGVRRRRGAWLMLVLLATAAGLGLGCGSGGSTSTGPTPNPNATPVGTYALKLAATAGSGSSAENQPVSLTLTVTE